MDNTTTLEDVLREMRKQTDLLNATKTIQEATKVLVSKPGGPAALASSVLNARSTLDSKPLDVYKLIEPDAKRVAHQLHHGPTDPHKYTPKVPKPARPKKEPGLIGRAARMLGDRVKQGRFGRAAARGKGAWKSLFPKGPGGGKGGGGPKGAGPLAVVMVAVEVVKVLNEFKNAVIKTTEAQLNAARRLQDLSPGMAKTFASEEIQELIRDMRTARATEQSTERLSQANQNRKDAQEGLENTLTNAKNEMLTVLNELITPPLAMMSEVAKEVYKFVTAGKEWKAKEEGASVWGRVCPRSWPKRRNSTRW